MRTAAKSCLLLLHVLLGLVLARLLVLDFRRWLPRARLVRWWHRRALDILQVRARIQGRPHAGPRLTVANHVSWLDICVIGSLEETCFVAKSEIADWPVAGALARACRTFYIRRGRGGSGPLLEQLVPFLHAGGSVTVFPEGTTTDGSRVLAFHPRLFAAAVDSGVPVQPVALAYGPDCDGHSPAPFIGDDDLVGHVLRVLESGGFTVSVRYFDPLPSGAVDRDTLVAQARTHITRHLGRGGLRGPAPAAAPGPAAVINL